VQLAEVRRAFAMALNDPAYPPGPYKFYNREFVVISYRSNIDRLREVVPEPLEVASDTVAYEFIRMPDSTGFGDYTETGQVIPVRFKTKDGVVQEGSYVNATRNRPGASHQSALARPNFMIKIIPHVDCTPRICELVRYYMEEVTVKGAWSGPAAIQLFKHAMCDVARLPVREVVSATHYITDLTLGLGEVVFDYLKDS